MKQEWYFAVLISSSWERILEKFLSISTFRNRTPGEVCRLYTAHLNSRFSYQMMMCMYFGRWCLALKGLKAARALQQRTDLFNVLSVLEVSGITIGSCELLRSAQLTLRKVRLFTERRYENMDCSVLNRSVCLPLAVPAYKPSIRQVHASPFYPSGFRGTT